MLLKITQTTHRNIFTAKCCGEWSKSALQMRARHSPLRSPAHHINSSVVEASEPSGAADWHSAR